jgi:uncharacterized repeat protein (TIGR01451 family)
MLRHWLQSFRSRISLATKPQGGRNRRPQAGRSSRLPQVDLLEDRLVPAQFFLTVNPALNNAGAVSELVTDIAAANSNGEASNVIHLYSRGTYTFSAADNGWYGPNALPAVTSKLTLDGRGATLKVAAGITRLRFFYVSGGLEGLPAGNLTLTNLTLRDGLQKGGDSGRGGGGLGAGGAIFNEGTLTLNAVTLVNNQAVGGNSGIAGLGDGGGGMAGDAEGGTAGGIGGGGAGGSAIGITGCDNIFGSGLTATPIWTDGFGGGFGGGGGFGAHPGYGGFGGGAGMATDSHGSIIYGSGGYGGGNAPDALINTGLCGAFLEATGVGGGGGAGMGGAIFNFFGAVALTNVTLTGNTAGGGYGEDGGDGLGGAVFNLDGGVVANNSTFVGNAVQAGQGNSSNGLGDGGALWNLSFGGAVGGASAYFTNCLVLGSVTTSGGTAHDVGNDERAASGGATVDLSQGDLVGSAVNDQPGDPFLQLYLPNNPASNGVTLSQANLSPLQDNGGLVPTRAPLPGGVAIDSGLPASSAGTSASTDARGGVRIVGPAVDAGAVEYQYDLTVTNQAPAAVVSANQVLTYTVSVTNHGPDATPAVTLTDVLPANSFLFAFGQAPGTSGWTIGGSTTVKTATISSLAAGASGTFTLVVQVNSNPGSQVVNTATVSPTTWDTDPGDDSATATSTIPEVLGVTSAGLTVNEGSSGNIIGSARLSVSDGDEAATALVYTLATVPARGTLRLSGAALAAGATFTQDDVNQGRLMYTAGADGSDGFTFRVSDGDGGSAPTTTFALTVGDVAVSAQGGFTVSAAEGAWSAAQTVATFTDPGGVEALADYGATIAWGDGQTSAGSISVSAGVFTVQGGHTYAAEGSPTITVTLTHDSAPAASVTSTANVSDPAVSGTGGFTVSATEGQASGSQTVATFTDPGGAEAVGDYSVSIAWGDGQTSAGTISVSGGTFTVQGGHTYAEDGSPTITVTLSHDSAPAVTVTSTASVADPAVQATGGFTVSATEGQASGVQTVATFTDLGGAEALGDYSARIAWGDGQTSAGGLSYDASAGTFTVQGGHTYTEEGSPTIAVSLSHDGAPGVTVTSTASIADPAVTAKGGFIVSAAEGQDSGSQAVATFTDPGGAEAVGDYSASIAWGDGQTSAGSLSYNAGTGTFTVSGHHVYAEESSPIITVTLSHDAAQATIVTSTVSVSDPAVVATGAVTVSALEGQDSGSQVVATFTDPGGAEAVGDYNVSIAWGDGQTSAGTLTVSGSTFSVSGSHTYGDEGNFAVTVTLSHDSAPAATATDTAAVADIVPTVTAGTATSLAFGATFTGSGSFTDASNDTWTATVDYGDGTGPQALALNSNQTFQLGHTYYHTGHLPVVVHVGDAAGTTGTSSTFYVDVAAPTTVYVNQVWAGTPVGADPDGSGPAHAFGPGGDAFATIQDGVNAVAPGGSVLVYNGAYPENDSLSRAVKLVAASGAPTALSFTLNNGAALLPGSGGVTAPLVNVTAGTAVADGITLASSGATVNVAAGPFGGGIVLGKSLTLSGAGAGSTVFQPAVGATTGLSVAVPGVTLRGLTVSGFSGSGILVQAAGSARILNAASTGNHVGVEVNGGTAFVQGTDLSNDTTGSGAAGLAAENGAVIDAGQLAGSPYGNLTGLGVSSGGNTFLGYTAAYSGGPSDPAVVSQAIRDLNTGGAYANPGPQLGKYDLPAQNDNFGVSTLHDLENLVYHDLDNPALGFVSYGAPGVAPHIVGSIHYYAADPNEGTATTGQKSIIRYIQVTFDSFVFLAPGAVDLEKVSGPGANGAVTVTPAGAVYDSVSGRYTVTLSFSGGLTEYGSLVDGNYQLKLAAGLFQGGGPGGAGLPAGVSENFWRLYGDVLGHRTIDSANVAVFMAAYRSKRGMPNYREYLDFNNDGYVDSVDYYQLLRRNGTTLNP